MSFTDTKFLIFFAVFLVAFAVCPSRQRRWVLLLGSAVYCLLGSWITLAFAVGFAVLNYILGELIDTADGAVRKVTAVISVLIDVLLLVAMKLLGKADIFALPVGFSFYSFTGIAYLVDVARGTCRSAGNLFSYVNFSMMFPKLMQGPIVRYNELQSAVSAPASGRFARGGGAGNPEGLKLSARRMQAGLERFVLGFCIKVLVADKLGVAWNDQIFGSFTNIGAGYLSTGLAWLGAVAFSIQLYIDWQSYMLMATGIAKMLGFELPENFDTPYAATTIGDYFRRWHITLTRWFKDYVYIPLGGNRKGMFRTILNILIVWLLTSLWHGLSWNFLIWGMSIGVFIVLEKLFLGKVMNKLPWLGHIYVLFLIPLTWVCFNTSIGSVTELFAWFGRMFPFSSVDAGTSAIIAASKTLFTQNFGTYWIYMLVGALFCTPYPERFVKRFGKTWIVSLILAALFWWAVYVCIKNGASTSMYANF